MLPVCFEYSFYNNKKLWHRAGAFQNLMGLQKNYVVFGFTVAFFLFPTIYKIL